MPIVPNSLGTSALASSSSSSVSDFTIGDKYYLTQQLLDTVVTNINIILQGSGGQSITWELRKGPDPSSVGIVVHTATTTSITSGDSINNITTPIIDAGDHVWFEFTSLAGTLIAFNATVTF